MVEMAVKALTPPGAWAWGTIPWGVGGGDWETGDRAHIYTCTFTVLACYDLL